MNILFLLVLVGMGAAATASPKSCPASLPTTAAQMKLVPPDCFAGMSYTKLRNVPAEACKGFTSDQLSKMATGVPYDFCEGFSSSCISNIQNASDFSAKCLLRLAPAACSGFSSSQLNSLKFKSSLRAACLANLLSKNCDGLNNVFVAALGTNPKVDQCGKLSNQCLNAIPDISRMHSPCFAKIVSVPDRCQYFSGSQMSKLPEVLAQQLSAECLGQVNTTVCDDLPWQFLGSACSGVAASCLSKSHLSMIGEECSQSLSGQACLGGLNHNNIRSIPASPDALSSDCLSNLSGDACQAASDLFLGALGKVQCASLPYQCIGARTSFAAFSGDCVSGFKPEYLGKLSLAQASSFSAGGYNVLSGQQFADWVKKFGEALVANLSLEQLAFPGWNTAADFALIASKTDFPPPGFTFNGNMSFGADATWLQIAWSTNGKDLVNEYIHQIHPSAVSGISPAHQLSVSTLEKMSVGQKQNLNCHTLKSFSSEMFSEIASPDEIVWPRLQVSSQYLLFDLHKYWTKLWEEHPSILNVMNCDAVVSIPPDAFWNEFKRFVSDADALAKYNKWRVEKCSPASYNATVEVPCSGWRRTHKVSLVNPPTTTTSPPTTQTPTTTMDPGLLTKRNIVIGCAVGGFVVLIAIVVVVVVIVVRKRRLARIEYTPLNTLAANVDLGAEW